MICGVIAVLFITVAPCTLLAGDQKDSGIVPVAASDNREVEKPVYDTPYICDRFCSLGNFVSVLPDGSTPDGRESYSFENISQTSYVDYIAKIEEEGFSVDKTIYGAFLFRDDCAVFLEYQNNTLRVKWYQKSPFAPLNGLTSSEAADMVYPEESLSDMAFYPIDVTPEGFFERTGGQIFAAPQYSFDVYKSLGKTELLFEDNEWYSCYLYYLKGDICMPLEFESVAIFDIDKDGNEEIFALEFGPTSGDFTFSLEVIYNEGISSLFYIPALELTNIGFAEIEGNLKVHGVEQQTLVDHYYDIVTENRDGKIYFLLYENGEPISAGFMPS